MTSTRAGHENDRRHQRYNGQAPAYTRLSKADIRLLTNILSHAPSTPTPSLQRSYEHFVRKLTSQLPSHLRSKLPFVSSFCSLHHNIVPSPVRSILHAFQHEIDTEIPRVWAVLRDQGALKKEHKDLLTAAEDISALWLSREDFEAKYHRQPNKLFNPDQATRKCAACILARVGGHAQHVTALGAFFIGRVDPDIWKKSNRIRWLEAWLRQAVDDAKADEAVREMWEMGWELRKVRKQYSGTEREYVDEVVAAARNDKKNESGEAPGQGKEPLTSEASPSFDETDCLADLTADDLFEVPGNPFDDEKYAGHGPSNKYPAVEEGSLPRCASSIYSREIDEDVCDPFADVKSGKTAASTPRASRGKTPLINRQALCASSIYSHEPENQEEDAEDVSDILLFKGRSIRPRSEVSELLSMYRTFEESGAWI